MRCDSIASRAYADGGEFPTRQSLHTASCNSRSRASRTSRILFNKLGTARPALCRCCWWQDIFDQILRETPFSCPALLFRPAEVLGGRNWQKNAISILFPEPLWKNTSPQMRRAARKCSTTLPISYRIQARYWALIQKRTCGEYLAWPTNPSAPADIFLLYLRMNAEKYKAYGKSSPWGRWT